MKKLTKLNQALLSIIGILALLSILSIFSLLIINNIKALIITKQLKNHSYPSLEYVSIGAADRVYSIPEEQEGMRDLSFVASPDGSKFAYLVIDDQGRSQVSINGQLGPKYEKIVFMTFSPDSNHFAYKVIDHGKQFIVLDGKEGNRYNWVLAPSFFTPNSRYFVYKVRNSDDGEAIVVNNDQSQWWERVYAPFVPKEDKEIIYYSRQGKELWKTVISIK